MSTALSLVKNELSIWENEKDLEDIKQVFGHGLTNAEFKSFINIGKKTGLNPFLKEIWCIVYPPGKDGKQLPAQFIIGRDGYRRSAQNNSDYDYHQCDAVYENDIFQVVNGEIRHSYSLKNRGALIGAYCIAKRKHSSKPMYVYAPLEEYSTGQSLWRASGLHKDKWGNDKLGGKPSTMIKKVAEAQCLRACFQELFSGTYCSEEFDKTEDKSKIIENSGISQTQKLKQVLNVDTETGEVIDEPLKVHNSGRDDILVTEEQIEKMYDIMEDKGFDEDRCQTAIDYIVKLNKVDRLEDLTDAQARFFILKLQKAE